MDEKILEEIRQVSREYPDGIHRRSEAKEMFEKLGYKILIPFDPDSNYIIVAYDKEMGGESQSVYFYGSKELRIVYEDKRGNIYPPIFDLDTLEAIDKKDYDEMFSILESKGE